MGTTWWSQRCSSGTHFMCGALIDIQKTLSCVTVYNIPSAQRRVKYLRRWLSCWWWLCDLDVLHLDGMLRVRLGVMKLPNIYCGVLGLVRWGSLDRKSKQRCVFCILCRSSHINFCDKIWSNKVFIALLWDRKTHLTDAVALRWSHPGGINRKDLPTVIQVVCGRARCEAKGLKNWISVTTIGPSLCKYLSI